MEILFEPYPSSHVSSFQISASDITADCTWEDDEDKDDSEVFSGSCYEYLKRTIKCDAMEWNEEREIMC